MKVVITGGAGFIGRKLAHRLLQREQLTARSGEEETIEKVILFDVVEPPAGEFSDSRIEARTGDVTDPALMRQLIDAETDSVFHLAAVVSAGAEADFDLGYHVNLDGTRAVLEACRKLEHKPRVVFASSLAAYGGDLPDPVVDETPLTPQTSYGAQKVIGEFLINDYSRKSFIDGRAMRLPTIVVRPGKPNKAASGFASSIIREPLSGIDFVCPVTPETPMAVMSPRKVIDAFVRMHELDGDALGYHRALLLSGIRVAMADATDAVGRLAGNRNVGKISFEIDDQIQEIVDLWPKQTSSTKAEALGFQGDASIDEIVIAHIEDELDR